MNEIKLEDLVKKMHLENLTPEISLEERTIKEPDVNRPALQLTGFFEHFDEERVQIIGNVEYTYIHHMEEERRYEAYRELLAHNIPCMIY